MKIKFWGVRGSIATPRLDALRYGGNTTCIQIVTDSGENIIIDAGTGIFPLAQTFLSQLPLTCSIFFSHTHWDHIQGLPFFIPIFIPGNNIHLYGAFDPIYQKTLKDILNQQMEYCYFPVRESELKADLKYTSLREEQVIEIGNTKVTNILMNHPVLNYGYKIECGDKKMFFTGDHEPLFNIYDPEDDYFDEYEGLINQKNQRIIDFIKNADVLIVDSAYTNEEYKDKKGWGHGTFDTSINLAQKAEVERAYLTHHEPTRTDDDLEFFFNNALEENKIDSNGPKFFLAQEGVEIEI